MGKTRGWLLFLSAFSAGMMVTAFLRWPPNQSSDWAAWVQAVGSIGAIVGAFEVGRRQAEASRRQAIDLDVLAQQRQVDAIVAVVNHSIDQATASADSFMNMPTDVLRFALQEPIYSLSEATDALLAIPLHEVGTGAAVTQFAQLQVVLKAMQATIDRFKALERTQALLEHFDAGRKLNAGMQQAQFHANAFIDAVRRPQ
jgi:hypothetical protein